MRKQNNIVVDTMEPAEIKDGKHVKTVEFETYMVDKDDNIIGVKVTKEDDKDCNKRIEDCGNHVAVAVELLSGIEVPIGTKIKLTIEIEPENIITKKDFEDGKIPSKLYHLTPVENLESIMKNGLKHDIEEDKKMFDWCEQVVYMFPRFELCENVCEIFYDSIVNKFNSLDEIEDIVVKYVILSIDSKGLVLDSMDIDEPFMGKENEEIVSYIYTDAIKPEYIKIEAYIDKLYHKEFLIDSWG